MADSVNAERSLAALKAHHWMPAPGYRHRPRKAGMSKSWYFEKWAAKVDPQLLRLDFLRDGGNILSLAAGINRDIEGIPLFTPIGSNAKTGQMHFWLEGTSGRPLWQPNDAMRSIHRRLIFFQRSHMSGIGFPAGKPLSPYIHGGGRYLYRLDLKDAFSSIDGWRLARLIFALGEQHSCLFGLDGAEYRSFRWGDSAEEIFDMLQRYFLSTDGGLFQGGNASPYLFHAYAHRLLDRRFISTDGISWRFMDMPAEPTWSYRHGLAYSRFVDDLIFTSKTRIGQRIRTKINEIVREAGFEVNTGKTRIYDISRAPIVLHGTGIRYTGNGLRMYLPRNALCKIEGMLHAAYSGRPVDMDYLNGLMGWFYSITDVNRMNRTEQRIDSAYRRL